MQKRFQLSFRDRWGEWVATIILFLLGLTLFLIFNNQIGQAQRIISAIGLTFIGSSSASAIILLLIGSNVAGLKEEIGHLREEIDKLHENTEQEIESIHTSVGEMSALITQANNIGMVAIGRSRDSAKFEGGKSLVERWKYFLEHGSEVDLICFRDRMLFNPNIVKEHKNLVPFTLIRGDAHIYIMFYLPGYSAGPLLELRPLEAMISQNDLLERISDNDKLFDIYKSYFDYMWNEKAQPIASD